MQPRGRSKLLSGGGGLGEDDAAGGEEEVSPGAEEWQVGVHAGHEASWNSPRKALEILFRVRAGDSSKELGSR